MPSIIKKPTSKEQAEAKQSVAALRQVMGSSNQRNSVLLEVGGIKTVVPRKAVLLLEKVLDEMADGRSVQIRVVDNVLTTQEAADLLQVSRPHLIKLLETGKIPFKMVGTHRRVLVKDLNKYHSELKKIRNESLDFLAKQAQELGFGYD